MLCTWFYKYHRVKYTIVIRMFTTHFKITDCYIVTTHEKKRSKKQKTKMCFFSRFWPWIIIGEN